MKTAGIILGIGFGGFIDGIVFHQLLQWHNIMSSVVPPNTLANLKYNIGWDGVFHLIMWILTLAGVIMLFRGKKSGLGISEIAFAGAMAFGWGLFNFLEGLINHFILGLHHVRHTGNYVIYDLTFLLVGGILLIVIGWLMMRKRERKYKMAK